MTEADLIKEVRSHPLLWDPGNKDYHEKHQRKLMWSAIQSKFGPGFIVELLIKQLLALKVVLRVYLLSHRLSYVTK